MGHDADARLLLVGHEPDFSQVVGDLTGARIQMKKGGVAAVNVERGGGELLALLRPKELRKLA
jgi:phosphohistidine phosphatase